MFFAGMQNTQAAGRNKMRRAAIRVNARKIEAEANLVVGVRMGSVGTGFAGRVAIRFQQNIPKFTRFNFMLFLFGVPLQFFSSYTCLSLRETFEPEETHGSHKSLSRFLYAPAWLQHFQIRQPSHQNVGRW